MSSSKDEKARAEAEEQAAADRKAADKKAAAREADAKAAHDAAEKHAADTRRPQTAAEKKAQETGTDEQIAARKAIADAKAEEERLEELKKIPIEYPKWLHHATQPSVLVHSEAEAKRLGKGWGDPTPATDVAAVRLDPKRLAEIQAEADARVAAEAQARADEIKRLQGE